MVLVAAMQFTAVTLLGLFVYWLATQWFAWVGNHYLAAGIWIGACILFAIIYDSRTASPPRSTEARKERGPVR